MSEGGRPKDSFVNQHTREAKDDKGANVRICIYCGKEIKGSVTRVRNNLSGLGNDISACTKVPVEIKEKAKQETREKEIQKTPKKRRLEENTNPVVAASYSINPPVQLASLSLANTAPALDQHVSSLNVVVNDFAERRQIMGNCIPDGELVNTTPTAPFQPFYSTHCSNVNVVEGRLGMNNCGGNVGQEMMSNAAATGTGVASDTISYVVNAKIAGGNSGMSNIYDCGLDFESINASMDDTSDVTGEDIMGALMKLLMCFDSSSDVTKDPHVRRFLETVRACCFPLSLLEGDPQHFIGKLLSNVKQELFQHMLTMKESWKTTGCTLMLFNLNKIENEGKLLTLGKEMYVLGFYSPKGILFMKTPNMDKTADNFKDALKQHSPSLDINDATHWILHRGPSRNQGLGNRIPFFQINAQSLCELSTDELSINLITEAISSKPYGVEQEGCLRHEILNLCVSTCWTSGWALKLLENAEQIHDCLSCDWISKPWYNQIFTNKGVKLKESFNDNAAHQGYRRLSIFLSIMVLKDDLRKKYDESGPNFQDTSLPILKERLDDSEFWQDGDGLRHILEQTLKIPDVMDTLVPTAGYLALAIDKAKDVIDKYYSPKVMPDAMSTFWKELESELGGQIKGSREAASYLNPVYFLQPDVQKQPGLLNKVKEALKNFVHGDQEWEKLNDELQRYGQVFGNLPPHIRLKGYHPVKLWEEHGHALPILRKCAVKLLSQPVSCMCNQVKKHMFDLQGTDDFILRLNVRLMEEFKHLGDDIYKPLEIGMNR